MKDHLNEISPCCKAKVVGIMLQAKGDEEKMCTKCGRILGIREKRLPYSEYVTKTEKRRGEHLFDSLFKS
jgi:hypothetical protein